MLVKFVDWLLAATLPQTMSPMGGIRTHVLFRVDKPYQSYQHEIWPRRWSRTTHSYKRYLLINHSCGFYSTARCTSYCISLRHPDWIPEYGDKLIDNASVGLTPKHWVDTCICEFQVIIPGLAFPLFQGFPIFVLELSHQFSAHLFERCQGYYTLNWALNNLSHDSTHLSCSDTCVFRCNTSSFE